MSGPDVRSTLREMWETRPARPREGREVAGVAAGIARRYDVDPVLVRIGFVAAAFTGVGAALYFAGWLLLPEEPGTGPRSAPRGIIVVGLVIAALGSFGLLFDGPGRGPILPLLAVAGLLFLLHRSRSDRGPRPVGADAPTTATGAAGTTHAVPVDGVAPVQPPAWDPLGAAPFAWDLPDPSPAPPPPPVRRPPVTSVTVALALLAGGATALVLLVAGSLTLATTPLVFGVALAVVGLGLLVGAFLRSGRGLLPIAVLLGVLTWSAVAAPLDRWQNDGVGDLRAAPSTVAQLQPAYARTAGSIDLDLSDLDLSVPEGGDSSPVSTRVDLGVGDVEVVVPRDADVRFSGSTGVGDVTFGTRSSSGPNAEVDVDEDLGADGVRSGRLLVLDVESGAGNVEVLRG